MMAAKEGLTVVLTVSLTHTPYSKLEQKLIIVNLQALILSKMVVESVNQCDPEGRTGKTQIVS